MRCLSLSRYFSLSRRHYKKKINFRSLSFSSHFETQIEQVLFGETENQKEIAVDESRRKHLSRFVGKNSEWRAKGMPWRIYSAGSSKQEIGVLHAMNRLKMNKPVMFQRMRVITVVPDLKLIEQLATNVAAPTALRGVVSGVSKASKSVSTNIPNQSGLEVKYGLPTKIRSLRELEALSAIYNEDVKLSSEWIESEEEDVKRAVEAAGHISSLMTRNLESGIDFFTEETRLERRFVYFLRRESYFWIPLSLLTVTPLLSSSTVMSNLFALESIPLLPKFLFSSSSPSSSSFSNISQLSDPTADDVTARILSDVSNTASESLCYLGSLGNGLAFAFIAASTRSIWLASFTELGFRLSAYSAFLRVIRGEPIVVQEMMMHTLRVPFITTISWFSNFRPGDRCRNLVDLRRIREIYTGSSK